MNQYEVKFKINQEIYFLSSVGSNLRRELIKQIRITESESYVRESDGIKVNNVKVEYNLPTVGVTENWYNENDLFLTPDDLLESLINNMKEKILKQAVKLTHSFF